MADDPGDDDARLLAMLVRLGLAAPAESLRSRALDGGVSSDIRCVVLPGRRLCVKRALPRLKVAADWRVPVERSRYEAEWLRVAHRLCPANVPQPLAFDADTGTLVLPWLDPSDHPVWKSELRAGRVDAAFAGRVAAVLAAVHSGTAGDAEVAARFDTGALFDALRLDPYLRATAVRHPPLAATLGALADRTARHRVALVHGDASPKNILVGPHGPVLLDAECAWYGDPAFDAAFCLNHLMLKCLWLPASAASLFAAGDAFVDAYLGGARWEPAADLAARIAALLPALMLARVDGKSPVEYLTDPAQQACVRRFATRWLHAPAAHPSQLARAWREALDAPNGPDPSDAEGRR